nr:hypothetical protein [Tanacetum cinerariifolium]
MNLKTPKRVPLGILEDLRVNCSASPMNDTEVIDMTVGDNNTLTTPEKRREYNKQAYARRKENKLRQIDSGEGSSQITTIATNVTSQSTTRMNIKTPKRVPLGILEDLRVNCLASPMNDTEVIDMTVGATYISVRLTFKSENEGCIDGNANPSIIGDNQDVDPYDFIYHGVPKQHRILKEQPPCPLCGAKRIKFEFLTFCCMKGKTKLLSLNIPEELFDLFTSQSELGKVFRHNIRAYNTNFSFTSMGVNLDTSMTNMTSGVYTFRAHGGMHHKIDQLVLRDGQPRYLQSYFYDLETELSHRLVWPNLDRQIVEILTRVLAQNPYVTTFRSLTDLGPLDDYRVTLNALVELDQRNYNLPTTSKVASIWIEGNNNITAYKRDIVVYGRWHSKIPMVGVSIDEIIGDEENIGEDSKEPNRTGGRKTVTMREYYSYKFQIRSTSNILLLGSRLLQQFVVDTYIKIETSRLLFIERNQTKIRADLYQDAMTLVQDEGKPDIFLTMTCNPNWPKIQTELMPGQAALDRPYLVSRPGDVRKLWDDYYESFLEDYRQVYENVEVARNMVLKAIKGFLQSVGKDIDDFDLPKLNIDANLESEVVRELQKEYYIVVEEEHLVASNFLNSDQRDAKNILYKALLAKVRSRGLIALTTASLGAAANNMPDGRIAHSRFKIPINLENNSLCNIIKQSGTAKMLRAAKLIIWDNASMAKRQAVEALDRSMQDITGMRLPFGGKIMVLGGDFRQVLPVVRRGIRLFATLLIFCEPGDVRKSWDDHYESFSEDYRDAYDEILRHVDKDIPGVFFIDGPGGTRKTFLYKGLLAKVRSRGLIVLATASSGAAANNIGTAKLLRAAKLIIWDEASMAKRQAVKALDRSMQNITGTRLPFGEKIMVLGGDFRQVLPVVRRETRAQIVDSILQMSLLWFVIKKIRLTLTMRAKIDSWFSDFLLRVGNGYEEMVDENYIRIPDDMTIPYNNMARSKEELINAIFPSLQVNENSSDFIISRAILSTKNEHVDELNDKLIDRFRGDEKIYYSFDAAQDDKNNLYPMEFLNSLNVSGLPPHVLWLKIRCPIILLRNLDPSDGLCIINSPRSLSASSPRPWLHVQWWQCWAKLEIGLLVVDMSYLLRSVKLYTSVHGHYGECQNYHAFWKDNWTNAKKRSQPLGIQMQKG